MILCLTHSQDFYTIDIVQQALQQAGYSTLRLNADEFAVRYRFDYSLLTDNREINLLTGDQKINAAQIQAVWYRKIWDLKVPGELDAAYRNIFIKEYNTYRQIFFNQLDHIPWMNKMRADHAAGNDKLQQLSAAQAAGLKIPKTIFTNDPSLIEDFFDRCNGDLVAKLHGALSKSMEGNTPFFPTTRLTKNDLQLLDGLPYCPMIFQEYIPKAYELRIVYVDGEFFTGKICHEQGAITDWRTLRGQSMQWQCYELPVAVQEKICRLMHGLDLVFGAIDMIRHTNGEYIFLEVNPQGEWGMLQRDLAYPIGETIAQKLIKHIKNA
jgi:glutathione synthase/RimK-type ligase-like ATP-grasp enzyme